MRRQYAELDARHCSSSAGTWSILGRMAAAYDSDSGCSKLRGGEMPGDRVADEAEMSALSAVSSGSAAAGIGVDSRRGDGSGVGDGHDAAEARAGTSAASASSVCVSVNANAVYVEECVVYVGECDGNHGMLPSFGGIRMYVK